MQIDSEFDFEIFDEPLATNLKEEFDRLNAEIELFDKAAQELINKSNHPNFKLEIVNNDKK